MEDRMKQVHGSSDDVDWEELRSAWSLYLSSVEVWMEAASNRAASMPTKVDVDQLIHAVIVAHNSWSDVFGRAIDATHHH
jgi:hypothetical protein